MASPWKAQQVTIVGADGKPYTVPAKVLGTLAVHKSLDGESFYVITHLPTGTRVSRGGFQVDALKIGFALWARWRSCLRLKTVAAARAAASPWMIAWLKCCNRKMRYHDPEEFRQ